MRSALLVVVVAALLIAWLALRDDGDRWRSDPSGTATTGSEPPAEQAETKEPDPPRAADERCVMRVRVDLSDGREEPVRIEFLSTRLELTATVRAGREEEIDVASLFTVSAARGLSVRASRPGYVPVERGVVTESGALKAVLHFRLDLAAVVHGRVNAPGARVGLFELKDGVPGNEPIAWVFADDKDGAYEFAAVVEGEHLVAAWAFYRTLAFMRVRLAIGTTTAAPPLVVTDGVSIRGHLLNNGQAVNDGAAVEAESLAEGTSFWFGNFIWTGDAAHPTCAQSHRDGENGYRIPGLPPGTYRVYVDTRVGVHPDVYPDSSAREAVAPAEGVDIDVPASRIRFVIEQDDPDVPAAGLDVIGEGELSKRISGVSGWTIVVVPGAQYVVRTRCWGRKPTERVVRAPAAGETLQIRMEPGEPLPESVVAITLRSPAGTPPESFEVQLRKPGSEELLIAWAPENGEAVTTTEVGRFRLLVLFYSDDSGVGKPMLWQNIERDIELVAGKTNRIVIDLKPGGSIRIIARNRKGRILQPRCKVLDAAGNARDISFSSGSRFEDDRLCADGASDVGPPLPPGRYTVTLELDGYVPWRRAVDVRAGARTKVEVMLKPR